MPSSFPRGIFPPMVTPFGPDGVDLPRARRHARRLVELGAHGLCVAGSGGEFVAMSHAERMALVDAVAEEVAGAVPLMVCVAEYGTDAAIRLGRHAAAAGAACLLATPPYFMRPPVAAVRRHFASIRAAVDLPVMLYNSPVTTGVDLPLAEIERLVDDGAIQAVKQSFYDAYHVRDARERLGDRAVVYCGHDGSALEALLSGAEGWISALPVLCTADARALWDGVQSGAPLDDLRARWRRLLPLVRFVFDESEKSGGSPHAIEVMKSALNILGQDVGAPRPPMEPVTGPAEARLRSLLAAAVGQGAAA